MSSPSKSALVTGGGRGIGLGIAKALAAEGWALTINGLRPPAAVGRALDELRSLGGEVLYVAADISQTAARRDLLERVRTEYGRLNLLVNNAGVAPRRRVDPLETREEDYEWLMGINLRGPYFLTQAAARWMIQQGQEDPAYGACIVNVTSVSANVVSVQRGEYCLSKAALSMATAIWANRLAEHGIPVYEVRPGLIRSDMTAAVQQEYDALIEQGLLLEPRWGTPEDVGRAVAMLARGDLSYATGQVLVLDGGLTQRRL